MDNQWFFSWGMHQFGPFSQDELKNLAAIGRLQPGDMVWKSGMAAGTGVVAARVKNLFAGAATHIVVAATVAPLPVPAGPGEVGPADAEAISPAPEAPTDSSDTLAEDGSANEIADHSSDDREGVQLVEDDSIPDQPSVDETAQAMAEDEADQVAPKRRKPASERKKQATAKPVRGVIVLAQDGVRVHFRKKCPKCTYEDNSRQSLAIRNGSMRMSFFCPTCKKTQYAEILGSVK